MKTKNGTNIISEFSRKINRLIQEHKPIFPNDYEKKFVISDSALESIVSACFFAGLYKDEERITRFRALFCSKNESSALAYELASGFEFFEIKNSPNLEPKALSKFCQAFDYKKTLICVSFDPDCNESAKVFGVLNLGHSMENFQRHQGTGSVCSPEKLILSCSEPGTIGVSIGDVPLGVLEKDQIILGEASVFSKEVFFPIFKKQFAGLEKILTLKYGIKFSDEERIRGFWTPYVRNLDCILQGIAQMQHGGCLVILPPESKSTLIDIRFPVSHRGLHFWNHFYQSVQTRYQLLFSKDEESEKKNLSLNFTNLRSKLRDYTSFVSHLSQVDGAVIIDKTFNIIGFGAILNAPDVSLKEVFEIDPIRNKTKKVSNLHYGTRHLSALKFLISQPEAVIIVFSQDGGITACIMKNKKATVVKNLNKLRYGFYFGL